MHLLLVRHGESTGNAAQRFEGLVDGPLTEVGRAQARALAQRLKSRYDVRAIYASPLQRARQTAEIAAETLGLALACDERLKEYDCGLITGMSFAELSQTYPEVDRGFRESVWHTPIPGEEGIELFQQRILSAVRDIVSRHTADDTIAIVAHYVVWTAYLGGLLELDPRKRPPWVLDNASLSIVELGGLRPRLVVVNDTCHLNHVQRGLGQGLERSESQGLERSERQ